MLLEKSIILKTWINHIYLKWSTVLVSKHMVLHIKHPISITLLNTTWFFVYDILIYFSRSNPS